MARQSRKRPPKKDLTGDFLAGGLDEDRVAGRQKYGKRSKYHQQMKTLRTAARRHAEGGPETAGPLELGLVIEVHGLFCTIETPAGPVLGVIRKTLQKLLPTRVVVGDVVRFSRVAEPEPGAPQVIVEGFEPRRTLLTRADSFKGREEHPIVANADAVLIVASVVQPRVKWQLIERLIVASRVGGLLPIVCLTKLDLESEAPTEWAEARERGGFYRDRLAIPTVFTSTVSRNGLDELRQLLKGKTTALAGQSGVGKSSLIQALEPGLHLRIGELSGYTGKGKHTTTSARRFALSFGGWVIDTPGVKLFGHKGLTEAQLLDCYPDVRAGEAPSWREEAFSAIAASIT
jgi:ribosome biogenesis GTPase